MFRSPQIHVTKTLLQSQYASWAYKLSDDLIAYACLGLRDNYQGAESSMHVVIACPSLGILSDAETIFMNVGTYKRYFTLFLVV